MSAHDEGHHKHDHKHDHSPASAPDERLNDRSDYQRCFACGARNPYGLRLVYRLEGGQVVTEFTADERYQGFPGVLHGGILATLLDETLERLGTLEGRWMMTGRLDVRYRAAAPVGRALRISARAVSSRQRALLAAAVVCLADDPTHVYAEAEGTFLPLPPDVERQVRAMYPRFMGAFKESPAGEPPIE